MTQTVKSPVRSSALRMAAPYTIAATPPLQSEAPSPHMAPFSITGWRGGCGHSDSSVTSFVSRWASYSRVRLPRPMRPKALPAESIPTSSQPIARSSWSVRSTASFSWPV